MRSCWTLRASRTLGSSRPYGDRWTGRAPRSEKPSYWAQAPVHMPCMYRILLLLTHEYVRRVRHPFFAAIHLSYRDIQPTEPPLHHNGYPGSTSATTTLYEERTDHALHYRHVHTYLYRAQGYAACLVGTSEECIARQPYNWSPDPRPNPSSSPLVITLSFYPPSHYELSGPGCVPRRLGCGLGEIRDAKN